MTAKHRIWSATKRELGRAVAAVSPQARFDRLLCVIGHMRCGSTALSSVLTSRDDVSGYGEAHIAYDGRDALGVLILNQWRRQAWRPRAELLFDKTLHSRYDIGAVPDFFAGRAIFLLREPVATIQSIRKLFASVGSPEYPDDEQAATYYERRLADIVTLHGSFDPARRVGLTYEQLVTDPAGELTRISDALGFAAPLENRYIPNPAAQRRGAGDPVAAPRHREIVARDRDRLEGDARVAVDLPPERIDHLRRAYADAAAAIGGTPFHPAEPTAGAPLSIPLETPR